MDIFSNLKDVFKEAEAMARQQAEAARQRAQAAQRPRQQAKKKKKQRPRDEFQPAEAHPEGSSISPLNDYSHPTESPLGPLTRDDLRRTLMLVEVLGRPPGLEDEDE